MDIQNLFQKKSQNVDESSKSQKLVSIGDELDDQPLIFKLDDNYKLTHASSEKRFDLIKNGSIDIGFISAIDYARLKGGWRIFPGICKSSMNDSKRVILFFNKSMGNLKKIAVFPSCRTSKTATDILMRERYQLTCNYHEEGGEIKDLLKKYDAVLISGDSAFENTTVIKSYLDISEEWQDMTGLPFVHGFWVGNEVRVSTKDAQFFLFALKMGLENLKTISDENHLSISPEIKTDYLYSRINYFMTDEEKASLEELYRYAFFYGMTEYIPDFNFVE